MIELHPSIRDIPLPPRMKYLPRSEKGFPVPWFVVFIDGSPDFRIIKPGAVAQASRWSICWICGMDLGQTATYVSGPMCGVSRTSAEPPSHHDCADYAARACPFLARPHARRRDVPREGEFTELTVGGKMIDRNPGVTMLWRTASLTQPWKPDLGRDEVLFKLPDPLRVDWVCEGREATFEEVKHSMESGIPLLREEALKDPDPQGAMMELHGMVKAMYYHLPQTKRVTVG